MRFKDLFDCTANRRLDQVNAKISSTRQKGKYEVFAACRHRDYVLFI